MVQGEGREPSTSVGKPTVLCFELPLREWCRGIAFATRAETHPRRRMVRVNGIEPPTSPIITRGALPTELQAQGARRIRPPAWGVGRSMSGEDDHTQRICRRARGVKSGDDP